jgi:plastocyanin
MKTKTGVVCLAGVLGVAVTLVSVGTRARVASAASLPAAQQAEVKIGNFTFAPVTLTVPKGTMVKWTNRDDIPHTVVSEDRTMFKSKPLDTDDSFTFTFDKPGTYTYFCSIHPKMTAKVVVE